MDTTSTMPNQNATSTPSSPPSPPSQPSLVLPSLDPSLPSPGDDKTTDSANRSLTVPQMALDNVSNMQKACTGILAILQSSPGPSPDTVDTLKDYTDVAQEAHTMYTSVLASLASDASAYRTEWEIRLRMREQEQLDIRRSLDYLEWYRSCFGLYSAEVVRETGAPAIAIDPPLGPMTPLLLAAGVGNWLDNRIAGSYPNSRAQQYCDGVEESLLRCAAYLAEGFQDLDKEREHWAREKQICAPIQAAVDELEEMIQLCYREVEYHQA